MPGGGAARVDADGAGEVLDQPKGVAGAVPVADRHEQGPGGRPRMSPPPPLRPKSSTALPPYGRGAMALAADVVAGPPAVVVAAAAVSVVDVVLNIARRGSR